MKNGGMAALLAKALGVAGDFEVFYGETGAVFITEEQVCLYRDGFVEIAEVSHEDWVPGFLDV